MRTDSLLDPLDSKLDLFRAMAPISLEQVSESLSWSHTQGIDLEECAVRGTAAASGAFFIGFSSGVALQVHYARYLPRSVRSLLVIPSCLAVGSSMLTYQHALTQCGRRWTACNPITAQMQTESG